MYNDNSQKPAYLKGFLWFAFIGTAMLSAVILPIHLWAITHGYEMKLDNFFFRLYFFVLISAALYHGLYRTETILFDLGILKHGKINTVIFLIACGITIGAALYYLSI